MMSATRHQLELAMHSWTKLYHWKSNITRLFKIQVQASIRKKTGYIRKIEEEQSWLGIG